MCNFSLQLALFIKKFSLKNRFKLFFNGDMLESPSAFLHL